MKPGAPEKEIRAQVVLACPDLDRALDFFSAELGFRLERIFPADSPRVAVLSRGGLRVRLDAAAAAGASSLLVETDDAALLQLARAGLDVPVGLDIDVVPLSRDVRRPGLSPALAVTLPGDDAGWVTGRAGMQYRDLVPDRLGGAWIASHIRIPDGGPVNDYVHYHDVDFQAICCLRGRVQVVYEDQGPPFVMNPGDCVLQPPTIRHRVLECSDGFEALEVASPAEHETTVAHDLSLPTGRLDPDRLFGGQRFCLHRAEGASWAASPWLGLRMRDSGFAEASGGRASVRWLAPVAGTEAVSIESAGEFVFRFVVRGQVTLDVDGIPPTRMGPGSSVVLPAGTRHRLASMSPDLELLEVASQ